MYVYCFVAELFDMVKLFNYLINQTDNNRKRNVDQGFYFKISMITVNTQVTT